VSVDDAAEWDLLGVAAVASFADAPLWRRTTFVEPLDGFALNEHLMGPAIQVGSELG
jgi:hypothetical protein